MCSHLSFKLDTIRDHGFIYYKKSDVTLKVCGDVETAFCCLCTQSELKTMGEKPAIYQLKLSSKNSHEDLIAYLKQKGCQLYLHIYF